MKTDENAYYHVRNIRYDKWIGRRKNGDIFWKEHKGGSCEFKGGPELDQKLKENPGLEAVKSKKTKKELI